MKNTWAILKSIIGTYKEHSDIFLSLIDEEGNIVCANSNMVKTLHLKNPRTEKTNFFDLLHPVHLPDFKTAIRNSCESNIASSMEIYLKNGYYHPMKWQVNCLENNSKDKTYLCLGHKILTNNQRKQFNLPGEDNVAGTYTVVSTIADLIAKKKLAMKLKEAKTLYRSFMDQTPNLAWVVDEDSKLVFASRAFYK